MTIFLTIYAMQDMITSWCYVKIFDKSIELKYVDSMSNSIFMKSSS